MAAQSFADMSSLQGLTQRVYSKTFERLWPDGAMLQKEIPFASAEAIGEKYVQGVQLTKAHGMTIAPSTATPTLNAAVTTKTAQALVDGYQSILRDRISYITASRILKSKNPSRALKSGTGTIIETLRLSHIDKLEAEFLYGQMGLSTVASTSGGTDIVLTAAEWGPGIWVGSEDMPIDVYIGATAVKRGTFNITGVNFDSRTLSLNTNAGIIAGDTIYYAGTFGQEFAGIHKILTNTGSLFNIDASQYSLWKATSYAAGGALTFAKLLSANSRSRSRGQRGKIKVLVNPATFVDLVDSIEQKRDFGGQKPAGYSPTKVEIGTESIVVYAPTGTMEIVVHDMVKAGYAYGLMLDTWKRIGSSDCTFEIPGRQGEYWWDLQEVAALEIRSFADWAPFCVRPAAQFIITGIVNTNG